MTEAEWVACKDAREMILSDHLNASPRKLRLLAVACCRCSRRLLLNPDHRRDLDLAERFADGLATEAELADAYQRVNAFACRLNVLARSEREIRRWAEATAVANAVCPKDDPASDAVFQIRRAAHRNVDEKMVALLRDIFGNPFHPIALDQRVRTHTVLVLARAAYDERHLPSGELDALLLAVLADALEEAGAADELVVHLRGPGPHVRGCWVVDRLLGKT